MTRTDLHTSTVDGAAAFEHHHGPEHDRDLPSTSELYDHPDHHDDLEHDDTEEQSA